jgi:formylglycine-generating enzyme required for sulfatase activity
MTPTCNDAVQNGNETDKDCGGGGLCIKCPAGKGCKVNSDCLLDKCVNGLCELPDCTDNVKNGDETDVDCGGSCQTKCAPGLTCKAASDCSSSVCTSGKCSVPSCSDNARNGTETDSDCGGPDCSKCAVGKLCNANSDCQQGICEGGICKAPSCSDGVKNGTESDVDCGGQVCPKCKTNKKCSNASDCVSSNCQLPGNLCGCPVGMVIVPRADGGVYCIDATEVTYDQYKNFWNTAQATPDKQIAACAANTTFTPTNNWPPQPEQAKKPVVFVDWCDANAYCASLGRRLCGDVDGGALDISENNNVDLSGATDHTKSEWYNACSAQGVNSYPYGNVLQSTWCNNTGVLTDAPHTIIENNSPKQRCQGGAIGLFDMNGNAAEWTNACHGGQCLVVGGSFLDPVAPPSGVSCKTGTLVERLSDQTLPNPPSNQGHIGFRCCL